MTVQSTETEKIPFNAFALPFSDILEQFDFNHQYTDGNLEFWERATDTGSVEVSIDYISGEVAVEKFNSSRRRVDGSTHKLNSKTSMEVAMRSAL